MTVNSKVMSVLLKSALSNSREEAVENVMECRSTLIPWCLSKLMPEDDLSLFQDRHGPKSHHILP